MLLVGVLASAPASAQTEEAKKAFDDGQAAFRARRYGEAAEAYERSARATPHPASLVNAAESWELDGNLVRAARACDWALTLPMDAALKSAVEQRLGRLLRSIGSLSFRDGAGVSATLDGTPVHPPEVIRVSHGRHRVAVAGPVERVFDVDVAMGETREVSLAIPREPVQDARIAAPSEPKLPEREPATSGPPVAAWVAFAVAGVGLAATTTFGLLTLGARSRFDDVPTRENADAFFRDRTLTNVSLVVTAVGAAAGVGLWLFWPKAPAHPGLGLGPRSAALRVSWD
jgi:hypothetical protein